MTGVTLIPSSGNTNDIAQKLAAVTVRNQVVISKAARELVERQHNLPVMSRLVSRLVEYLGMTPDEVSLSELCRELTLDPKAALLVLKAANASSNGVSREIVNVQDAIRLLGVQRALGHVLASTVTDGTEELAKGVLGEQRKWHARRGILTAITASTFAEKLEDRSSETGRLFGILQDVGILLFLRQYPDQYVALLRRWRTSGHLKLAALEQMELGCTHAEVSAALLDYWDMPGAIIHPVMHHLESTPNAVRLGVDPGLHRANVDRGGPRRFDRRAPSDPPRRPGSAPRQLRSGPEVGLSRFDRHRRPYGLRRVSTARRAVAEPGGSRNDGPLGFETKFAERAGEVKRGE